MLDELYAIVMNCLHKNHQRQAHQAYTAKSAKIAKQSLNEAKNIPSAKSDGKQEKKVYDSQSFLHFYVYMRSQKNEKNEKKLNEELIFFCGVRKQNDTKSVLFCNEQSIQAFDDFSLYLLAQKKKLGKKQHTAQIKGAVAFLGWYEFFFVLFFAVLKVD